MQSSRIYLVLLASFSLAVLRPTSAAGSELAKVRPRRFDPPSVQKAEVTQFLAADRKDHLYFLQGDNLDVFRIRGAELEPAGKLACPRPQEGAYAAAMDPSGSKWVVSGSPWDIAVCDFREHESPAGFKGLVSSATWSGSGPLVAVVPRGSFGPDSSLGESAKAPRVLMLEDNAWKPVVTRPAPDPKTPFVQLKAEMDALICTDPKGTIWLAAWNAYRVQEASAFEKPKWNLVVAGGKVGWTEWTGEDRARVDAAAGRKGLDPGKNQVTGYPENVLRAILCARDGSIYLLVSTDEGLALDRFDPSLETLERVLLDGVKVGAGPMTAVLSSDELVFGGRLTRDGLWRISVEDLATASWKPVPGARLNGKPMQ